MSESAAEAARSIVSVEAFSSRDPLTMTAPAPTSGQPSEALEIEDANPPAGRDAAEDESHYPTGPQFYAILLSITLVLILYGADSSIVAVAVPSITDQFHTVADIGWYSAAYRLSACSFQFLFGKLYTIFSVKHIFLISVLVFMLASVLCAAAPSSAALVLGRAVCGFSGAGVLSGCFTMLVQCLPLRKRPLYAGILGSVEGVAVIASPILGGVIVERLGWRWCFWVTLPLGGCTLFTMFFFLTDVKPQRQLTWSQRLSHLDLLGTAVFVPSLTALFLALSWAGTRYPWNSPTIIGLFATFAVLLGVFAWDQVRRADEATLPPRILRNRSVLAGFVFSMCTNSAINVVEYYLPTYFQAIRTYSPAESGYLMLPLVLGFLLAMLAQGSGVTLVGYYVPFMLAGSLLMPIFAGLLTTLTTNTDLARILCYAGFYGFAAGIGFQAPQTAVQASLPAADASIGLAIILFAQQFGPAVFISAAQSIFTNRLSQNLAGLAPGLNSTSFIEGMGLTDLKEQVGAENLQKVLLGVDRSLMQTWYLNVALTLATIIGSVGMEWRSVKKERN